MIKSYRTVEGLDFDVLATGHGAPLFTKADVTTTRDYFEDLVSEVSAASSWQVGRRVEAERALEKYKTWANYERLALVQRRSGLPQPQALPRKIGLPFRRGAPEK